MCGIVLFSSLWLSVNVCQPRTQGLTSARPFQCFRMGDLDKDKDPSESLMDLMKKMYDEGDDEMKRTIAKAWTESREKQAAGSMI